MVYMSGSKNARYSASLTNQTSIFGTMAGLIPSAGMNATTYRSMVYNGSGKSLSFLYNQPPARQQLYLRNNNLLSVNPASSGGVGRMFLPTNY